MSCPCPVECPVTECPATVCPGTENPQSQLPRPIPQIPSISPQPPSTTSQPFSVDIIDSNESTPEWIVICLWVAVSLIVVLIAVIVFILFVRKTKDQCQRCQRMRSKLITRYEQRKSRTSPLYTTPNNQCTSQLETSILSNSSFQSPRVLEPMIMLSELPNDLPSESETEVDVS